MAPPLRLAIALTCLAAGLAAAAPRQLALPLVAQGPELRGDLSDPAWKQAVRTEPFVAADGISRPHAETDGLVLADGSYLYVGFTCHEPQIGGLVAGITDRDGTVWADDCIEFTLDPQHGGASMYHWAVNAKGAVWDGQHGPRNAMFDYNSRAEARCSVGADRWTCELRIPWEDVGGKPLPGEIWGLNLCRERKVGNQENTSWSPTYGNFTDPAALGAMSLPAAPGQVTLTADSRGGASSDLNDEGGNVFQVSVGNQSAETVVVSLSVGGAAGKAASSATVPAGRSSVLRLPYKVPATARPELVFRASVDGTIAYERGLKALQTAGSEPRVWVVSDPLFHELFSTAPPGLGSEGHLMWRHATHDPALLRETAVRFATRYVLDEAYAEYARHHCKLITGGVPEGAEAEAYARHQLGAALYGPEQAPGVPWVLDPSSIEHYLQEFERRLSAPHPHVWGVYAGDESNEVALEQGASLRANAPADYPYIQQADEEVRRLYGGGKWGIPEGPADPNPYRWIAFRRWCDARFLDRHLRLRELVRRLAPELRIVSLDPIDRVASYEWSSQAECFDIFTQQYTPRRTQWRAVLGCMTKVLVDLTGREVWPCAHVENYTMDTTPEEAVSDLSQIFRNGGHGVHLYMVDTANGGKVVGDTRVCQFGSPARWRSVMNTVDLMRTMPRPRLPAPTRQAILFNDDTLQSEPYQGGPRIESITEACYTALGPVARSWFTFIDCAQALKSPSLNDQFDLITLPQAKYLRPEIVAKLRAFVEQGGTLVCTDPEAFATDTVGNDTSASRTELFGVRVVGDEPVMHLVTRAPGLGDLTIPFQTHEAYLEPVVEGVTALATWDTGKPAITSRKLGQGRAILFVRNFIILAHVPDPRWREFFTHWVSWTGAPTGLDIWRFSFPKSVIEKAPVRPGFCLTNNHVVWQEERPRTPQNRDVGATYSYSLAPDAMPDDQASQDVPCTTGHLTDRRESVNARKAKAQWYAGYELPAERWMVSWAAPDPVSITFDLRQMWALQAVRLWFRDTLPVVTVETSADGREWTAAGLAAGETAGADVRDVDLALAGGTVGRYVRVSCAARRPGERLSLVEAEVWGDEAR